MRKGRVSRCLRIAPGCSSHGHPTSANGASRALPLNHSPEETTHHNHSIKKSLRSISEVETADEMAFVDFQQGSTSNNNTTDPQRPQYYGSGLGDVGFIEDDDDYEFLLDEALARDGLYRGMSFCNLIPIYYNLI